MPSLRRWLVLVVVLCAAWTVQAQQPLAAQIRPDLRVYPQFFSLAQGAEGDLYIGGTDGILRFDGGRWHWLPTPRPGAVRSLHVDARGRVWFGAQDNFGYVARDASGRERIVDLSSEFASRLAGRSFSDIWRIAENEEGIWFQALQDLFLLGPDAKAAGYWHHEGRFGGTQRVGDEIWVQWRDEGLKRRRNGAFEMLPGGERFAQPLVQNLLWLGDGRVLVHDRGPRLTLWRDDRQRDRARSHACRVLRVGRARARARPRADAGRIDPRQHQFPLRHPAGAGRQPDVAGHLGHRPPRLAATLADLERIRGRRARGL
jgi:ligand-binding sensor domain-containing protein